METETAPFFSRSQRQVYDLLMKGYSSKKIADCLFVTEKTVKGHLTNIYKILNIRGRKDINFTKADQ